LVQHVLVIGLFVIIVILTFRITFGHVLLFTGFVKKIATSVPRKSPSGNAAGPSPYLGQRPQYSRYGGQQVFSPGTSNPQQPGEDTEEAFDDEGEIDFDADFSVEDDPLNDINLHKQQVGMVHHGSRQAQQINLDEHRSAVQGARQQPLPFD